MPGIESDTITLIADGGDPAVKAYRSLLHALETTSEAVTLTKKQLEYSYNEVRETASMNSNLRMEVRAVTHQRDRAKASVDAVTAMVSGYEHGPRTLDEADRLVRALKAFLL